MDRQMYIRPLVPTGRGVPVQRMVTPVVPCVPNRQSIIVQQHTVHYAVRVTDSGMRPAGSRWGDSLAIHNTSTRDNMIDLTSPPSKRSRTESLNSHQNGQNPDGNFVAGANSQKQACCVEELQTKETLMNVLTALEKKYANCRCVNRSSVSPPDQSPPPTLVNTATATSSGDNNNQGFKTSSELQETNALLLAKLKALEMELENSKKESVEAKNLQHKITEMEEQQEKHSNILDELYAQNVKLREQIADGTNSNSNSCAGELDELRDKLALMQRDMDDLQHEKDNLKKEQDKLKNNEIELQIKKADVDRKAVNIAKIIKENGQLNDQIKKIANETTLLKNREMELLKQEHFKEKAALEKALNAIRQEGADLTFQLGEANKTIETLKKESVHRAKYNLRKNEAAQLKSQYETTQKELEETTKELKEKSKELEETKGRMEVASGGNKLLHQSMSSAIKERDDMKNENAKLRKQVDELKAIIRKNLQVFPQRLDSIKSDWSNLKQECEKLSGNFKRELATLNKGISKAVSPTLTNMNRQSHIELQRMQEEVRKKDQEIACLKVDNNKFQINVENQKKHVEQLHSHLKKYLLDITGLKQELKEKVAQIARLEDLKYRPQITAITSLEANLQEMESRFAKYEEALKRKETELSVTKEQIQKLQASANGTVDAAEIENLKMVKIEEQCLHHKRKAEEAHKLVQNLMADRNEAQALLLEHQQSSMEQAAKISQEINELVAQKMRATQKAMSASKAIGSLINAANGWKIKIQMCAENLDSIHRDQLLNLGRDLEKVLADACHFARCT